MVYLLLCVDEGCILLSKYGAVPTLLRILSYLKIEEDADTKLSSPRIETLDIVPPSLPSQKAVAEKKGSEKMRKARAVTSPAPAAGSKKKGVFKRLLHVLDKTEETMNSTPDVVISSYLQMFTICLTTYKQIYQYPH